MAPVPLFPLGVAQQPAQPVLLVDRTGQAMNGDGTTVSQRELVMLSATGVAGAAVTLTIPAGAAGIFNYLIWLQMVLYATAAMAGAAAPFVVATTGIPNTPGFTFRSALNIGETAEQDYMGNGPIKGSAVATQMTIVAPAATGGIWRINAAYFQNA